MEYPFSKKYSWCISGREFGSFRCHSSGGYENPLADPGIVGVSSGAGLAGVIMLIFMPEASLLLTPVAFIGAMLSACAVYSLAWKMESGRHVLYWPV